MRKLKLRSFQSPGDIVMLTAAIRDLHRSHPGEFLTSVDTSCNALFENNPYISTFSPGTEVEVINCEYPLVNASNSCGKHFIHGYIDDLNHKLGLKINLTEFKGDIYLSEQERNWTPQVEELTGDNTPYWIINAGGKFDFTNKWWASDRYQQVVNKLQGKVRFVQIGEVGHMHKPLDNVVNLIGKTDLRQLVRLIYHAQGVLCPVTAVMHLAKAVPLKQEQAMRGCVVIAGGREPVQWEAYPEHRFLHRVGQLSCCKFGGCWKSRVVPLNDGDEKDESLCEKPINGLPACMDMITADEVVAAIQSYDHFFN